MRETNDKYESKSMGITLVQVAKKKESTIGKAIFDLAEHIGSMGQGSLLAGVVGLLARAVCRSHSCICMNTNQVRRRLAFR